MKKSLVQWVLAAMSFTPSWTVSAETIQYSVLPTDHLFIRGFRGQLKVRNNPEAKTVRIQYTRPENADWQVQIKKISGEIQVVVTGPVEKEKWVEPKNWPITNLEVEAPGIPMEIYWHQGQVQVARWTGGISATIVSGDIQIERCTGPTKLESGSGNIRIRESIGRIQVSSYNAAIEIIGSNGELQLENYIGATQIKNQAGETKVVAHRGSVNVAKSKGRLELANDRAAINIDDFEGALRGKSGPGSVTAKLIGEIDVQLKSDDGDVRLRVPESGADVSVATAQGQLIVPKFLQTKRTDNLKTASGRLRGTQPGRIVVRSQGGSVQLN